MTGRACEGDWLVLIDTDAFMRPEMRAVDVAGRALLLAGLCWSARNETAGFIPSSALVDVAEEAQVDATAACSALVDAELWEVTRDGWIITNHWLKVQWEFKRRPTFTEAERQKMTPALRRRVISRWGSRCIACGWPNSPEGASNGKGLEIDHVVPLAKGGKTEFDNLQVLCGPCNRFKGTDDWDVFVDGLTSPKREGSWTG